MAITTGAKKAIRQAARRKVVNIRRDRAMTDAIKSVRELFAAGKKAEAEKALAKAYQAIDKAAKIDFIKKNAASRYKSRLAALFKKTK